MMDDWWYQIANSECWKLPLSFFSGSDSPPSSPQSFICLPWPLFTLQVESISVPKKCSLQSSAFHSYFLLQKFREACKETSANSLVKYWHPHHHPPTQSSTFNKQKRTIPITQDENQQLINLTSIIIMFRNFFSGWCETNCDRNFLGLPHSCTLDLSGHRWKRKNILEQPIFTFACKIAQKPILPWTLFFQEFLLYFFAFRVNFSSRTFAQSENNSKR